MNVDETVVISDDGSETNFKVNSNSPILLSSEESDVEFDALSTQSVSGGSYEDDEFSSYSSDSNMTTGTQHKPKESSVRDETDVDLPRISRHLSRHAEHSTAEERQSARDTDHRRKIQPYRRHHHHRHRHKENVKKQEKNDENENFPKALKPLKQMHSDDSLPDLTGFNRTSSCDKENGKKKHSKSKKSVRDEWRKYVPPLFSVVSDRKDSCEETYGERQRNLYNKLNDSISAKKPQKLYKNHKQYTKVKSKDGKRHSLVKICKNTNYSRQQQNSLALKSPNKKSIKDKTIEKWKRKNKMRINNSTFKDPYRCRTKRIRRPSEQSESSVVTLDSVSSYISPMSCTSQHQNESESVSDNILSPDPDDSEDELDIINANLVRRRDKRQRSFEQRRALECLTPIQRSFSCIEKFNRMSGDESIFDIINRELSETQDSLNKETKVKGSPFEGFEKPNLQVESCRNSTEKAKMDLDVKWLNPSCEQSSPSRKTPKKEMPKFDRISDSSTEPGVDKPDNVLIIDDPSYTEKVKYHYQLFKQKLRSNFQKTTSLLSEQSAIKIDRHFLDVLANDEKSHSGSLPELNSSKNEIQDAFHGRDKRNNHDPTQGLAVIKSDASEENIGEGDVEKSIHSSLERQNDVKNSRKEPSSEGVKTEVKVMNEHGQSPVYQEVSVSTELIKNTVNSIKTEKSIMDISESEESPLPRIQLKHKRHKSWMHQNLFQKTFIGDLHVKTLDLNTTNLYACSVPLHRLELTKNDIYVSELPVIKIDLTGTSLASYTKYSGEGDTESPVKKQISPIKNQPLITNFFEPACNKSQLKCKDQNSEERKCVSSERVYPGLMKTEENFIADKKLHLNIETMEIKTNKCDNSVNLKGNSILQTIPKVEKSGVDNFSSVSDNYVCTEKCDMKYEIKKFYPPTRDCWVKLQRLKEDMLPKVEKFSSEEETDKPDSPVLRSEISRRKQRRKRKINCQRSVRQVFHLSSSITSFPLHHSSTYSKKLSHVKQLKQLECFLPNARIGCKLESTPVLLPQTRTDIIESCLEEGSYSLQHNLEFLKWSFIHYKPESHLVSRVLDISFFSDVNKELVFEAFHLLLQINSRFPGLIKVEWEIIERCLTSNVIKKQSAAVPRVSSLQTSLLLKLLIEVIKQDLYSKNLSEQREIRKSSAYKLFSCDVHSLYPRDLIKYLGLLLDERTTVSTVKLATKKDLVTIDTKELIHELLEVSVEVSTSCVYQASLLAEDLKKLYHRQSGTEGKISFINSVKSGMIRYKLTELILESEYSGTNPVPARFPDSLLQVMECFSKAVPMKLGSEMIAITSEDCEELAMLMYYVMTSYLECCKRKSNESLRARVEYYSSKDLATLTKVDDLNLLSQYIDDFLDHLLSLNGELTPATEQYIMLMQCLSDLDS